MKRPPADFGRRLREARLDRRWSLADLAVRVGLSKGHLSGIETGRVGPPRDRIIRKLARALDADEADFLKQAHRDKMPLFLRFMLRSANRALHRKPFAKHARG